MATIASLNVSVGLITKDLQKGLGGAERSLRQSGAKFSRIGNDITTSLSLPIGLLGFSAIKAAGEFEAMTMAMRSTFQNAGKSISEADAEVEKLRKSAKAPGLDFEQAVKASIRLQSVGLSADNARETIEELANAVASTGGTAENLSSVTVQFSQMISKGKVLAGDLRIVQENLPIISDLMKKAFGTSNSEDIQKLGISGKEFVTKITAEMGKLNRVQGGMANSLVNAGSAFKEFLAGIGDEINKVFDLDKQANKLSDTLSGLTGWFKGLSDGTKKFIMEMALVVVVIGPALKAFGSILLLGSTIAGAFKGLAGLIGNVLTGNILKAADAFKALNAAQKANLIGALIVAVTALYFAYDAYANSLSAAQIAQKSVHDAELSALTNAQEQKTTVDLLVTSYKNEKTTLDEKKQILEKLKSISSEYYGQIKVGKGDVDAITEATKNYVEQLVNTAKIEAFKSNIVEAQKAVTNMNETIGASYNPAVYFGAAMQGLSSAIRGNSIAQGYNNLINEEHNNRVEEGINVQKAKIAANEEAILSMTKITGKTEEQIKAEQEAAKASDEAAKASELASARKAAAKEKEIEKTKALKEVLNDINNENILQKSLGIDDLGNKLDVAKNGLKKLIDAGWNPNSAAVVKLSEDVKDLQKEFDILEQIKPTKVLIDVIKKPGRDNKLPDAPIPNKGIAAIDDPSLAIQNEKEIQNAKTELGKQAAQASIDIFNNIADQKKERELRDLDEKGKLMLANAKGNAKLEAKIQADLDKQKAVIEKKAGNRKKISAMTEVAINTAVAISEHLGNPIMAGLVAAAGAIQLAVIASQKFAAGTRDAPGGMALVGERGPEIVNIPKHSQVFSAGQTSTMLRGGGSNMNISGEFMVKGTDLVLVLERTQNKLSRVR